MLYLDNVDKSYGEVHAVRGVSFAVQRGEIVGLLGANGAGKTTTLNMIAGLLRADSGTIRIGGADLWRDPDRARQQLGFAPQATGIYPTITVRQNLEFFGRLEGMRRAAARERADELIQRLSLTELADRQTMALSGGERRRTHIAAAMMHSPSLLILDEPSVGMDVHARGQLLELVEELARQEGMAVCFSSHYMHEVETVCDRAVVIHRGSVMATGTVHDIVTSHAVSRVELTFSDGRRETREVRDIKSGLPDLMSMFSGELAELRSVDVMRASLESAFLSLTGVRSEEDEEKVA